MPHPEYIPYRKPKKAGLGLAVLAVLVVLGLFLVQIPRVKNALAWRLDIVFTYARMVLNPVEKMPTPAARTQEIILTPQPSATVPPPPSPTSEISTPTAVPTAIPTPVPASVTLNAPAYDPAKDKQTWNNCGPATLALALRYYGWEGNQHDIAKIIKPIDDDRNVNVDELVYYTRTRAGWLSAEYRVGGNLDTIKKFIAAGYPVIIEESFRTDRQYWPQDDRWAGHYLLITAYDDHSQLFTTQDSEIGPNQTMSYLALMDNWQSFNFVYIIVFPTDQEEQVKALLGADVSEEINRQHALDIARREVEVNPQNAFGWFNLGSNLVYFEKYAEAAQAYDQARNLGLPERMLRYQFGPFLAYFHTLRTDDLLALTKYALQITRTSEEAMLWRGWALYRQGDKTNALQSFRNALKIRPDYGDALYALDFVTNN